MTAPGLQAVLWDMDGTLVDSDPYWIAAEYELVAEHGGRWTDADAEAIVGSSLLDGAAYLRAEGSVDLPLEEIVEQLLARVIAGVRRETVWQPGARELLAELRAAAVPCALVTMSYRELAMAVVDQLPAGTFDAVVTGDVVTHGKPHPEPYLRAAQELGVEPAACIALEDSPTGLASAEGAGCVAIGIPHAAPVSPQPGRMLVDSIAALGGVAGLRAIVSGRLP